MCKMFPRWVGMVVSGLLPCLKLAVNVGAQDWEVISDVPADHVVVSADGSKMAAVSYLGRGVYASGDGGRTWGLTDAPTDEHLNALASSADGARLFVVGEGPGQAGGAIYLSTNSGAIWTATSAPTNVWESVACSADGTYVAAAGVGFYLSADGGATWKGVGLPGATGWWRSIAMSADGVTLAVVSGNGTGYTSTNCGVTWTAINVPLGFWPAVASSADGSQLVLASYSAPIYVSTNFGAAWWPTTVYLGEGGAQSSVASSADGTTLVVAGNPQVLLSTNGGCSWSTNLTLYITNYVGVASSADGHKLVASLVSRTYILQTLPSPVLSLTASQTDVSLSWLVPSMKFVLQEKAATDTAQWTEVPVPPTLVCTNLHYRVTVPKSPQARFYRLALVQTTP